MYGRVCVYNNNNNHRRKHIFLWPPRETTVGQGAGTVRASCRQTRDAAYVIEISWPFTEGVRDVSGLRVEGFCPGGVEIRVCSRTAFRLSSPVSNTFARTCTYVFMASLFPRTIISAGVQKTCRKSTISHSYPTPSLVTDGYRPMFRPIPINGGRYTCVSFSFTREIHQNG